jgi:2-polyprenyl-3-methyl-5-hydroxy-6-metoxy-1,4-benzoquinol methylase
MRISVPTVGASVLGVENSRPAKVRLADAFGYPGVGCAYRHRPPYPDMVFDVLTGLITDTPATVLDLGAGEGALARPLAARVDQVDAVDISAAMIEEGRRRPGGDAWMTPEEAASFDRAATEVIAPFEVDGWLDMTVVAEISWGTVRAG